MNADDEGAAARPDALPRVLVAGGRGQLGTHLRLAHPGDVLAPGRDELDITRAESVAGYLDRHQPAVVINAAAYTDVDGAEADESGAHLVNVEGPRILAESCRERGLRLVHVSTDYVFSGEVPRGRGGAGRPDPATAPALEPTDVTDPATVYGRTKLAGEHAVLAAHPEATILRTSWLYTGPGRERLAIPGGDFVATMARLERERDEVSVVDDQWGSPTHAPTLAAAILEMLAREAATREAATHHAAGETATHETAAPAVDTAAVDTAAVDTRGLVLHAAGAGRATWYEVARRTFAYLGADPDRVRPCTTADFPRPAPRPAFSVLSGRAWAAAGLTPLPDWDDSLRVALGAGPGAGGGDTSSSSPTPR
ncbi:SDR family oxidoreductase [Dietzia cinnamea]|uniref:SDR family oxidoreductase n=1 Tax=Dietzia cinnamea TaxID=321318 RepID=UPI0021A4E6A0|nr:NAD(P)-dependent oxidoreductase [Dietzia cinnamea]MCT2140146.1 NAD(P)-dependent oxidoreductase [Dietzia cinnamea]